MRRQRIFVMLAVISALALSAMPASAQCYRWVLYDDFSSGAIDPSLWESGSSGGTADVVNGKLRFRIVEPDSKVSLEFQDPLSIHGVRAKVRIQSISGNPSHARARIEGILYRAHGYDHSGEMALKGNTIRFNTTYEDQEGSSFEPFSTYFQEGAVDTVGKTFEVSIRRKTGSVGFQVKGYGSGTMCPSGFTRNPSVHGWFLGAKVTAEADGIVVLFDDVHVLREARCY